jgi:hypothetical protein
MKYLLCIYMISLSIVGFGTIDTSVLKHGCYTYTCWIKIKIYKKCTLLVLLSHYTTLPARKSLYKCVNK